MSFTNHAVTMRASTELATIYMRWKDIRIGTRTFSMAHLQPFDLAFDIANERVVVKFEFGLHCFTDDKGNGHLIRHRGEHRYFCSERYHCSTQLVEYIQKRFFQGLAVPSIQKAANGIFASIFTITRFFSRSASRKTLPTCSSCVLSQPTKLLGGGGLRYRKASPTTFATSWKCVTPVNLFKQTAKSPAAEAVGLFVNLNIGLSFRSYLLIPLTG